MNIEATDADFDDVENPNEDDPPRWKTKDGRELLPREMTNDHLLNAIRYAQRTWRRKLEVDVLNSVAFASMLQGEMAQYCAEQVTRELMDLDKPEDAYPVLPAMIEEAAKRGLKP